MTTNPKHPPFHADPARDDHTGPRSNEAPGPIATLREGHHGPRGGGAGAEEEGADA